MSEQSEFRYMFYFDILKSFQEEKVKYLVVGGFAVYLHGVPRVTNDLDIIISLDATNISKVQKVMASLGYVPRLPGVKAEDLADKKKLDDWIKHKNMLVFTFFQPTSHYRQMDILLLHPLDFKQAYKKKETAQSEGVKICTVCVDDLIAMKTFSGRKQDISDIEHLKRAAKINGKKKN